MKRRSKGWCDANQPVLSAQNLTAPEVRLLVTNYYDAQEARIRGDHQLKTLGDKKDPLQEPDEDGNYARPLCLQVWADTQAECETQLKKYLKEYADNHPVGRWMLAQLGVGPITAAGLLAHLDITVAPTAGHFWRYAGLDPSCKWERGQKRPYNHAVKQLCWHLGQEFMKNHKKADCVYGNQVYAPKKAWLVERNERGDFAERAKTFFTKSADVKKTLAEGKLPAGNIDGQARMRAVKIFLSHLHAIMYFNHYHVAPPKPFVEDILRHVHIVKVPDMWMFPGFQASYYGANDIRRRPRIRLETSNDGGQVAA